MNSIPREKMVIIIDSLICKTIPPNMADIVNEHLVGKVRNMIMPLFAYRFVYL